MPQHMSGHQDAIEAYIRINSHLANQAPLNIKTLEPHQTVFIITDMIKGFAHEGPLASPRVGALEGPIAVWAKAFEARGSAILAFADAHPEDSPEFSSYPPHCLAGTEESQIVDQIADAVNLIRIDKNSTNGYLEPKFQDLLQAHKEWQNFVIVGDCTDICIVQLAVTLKTHFNRLNKRVRVIAPQNLVDTYDYDLHQADLLHVMGLYTMWQNGVEVPTHLQNNGDTSL